jgi:DNA polymerase II small subunit
MSDVSSENIVKYFLDKDILVSPDMLNQLSTIKKEEIYDNLLKKTDIDFLTILNKELIDNLGKNKDININWVSFDSAKAMAEKNKNHDQYTDVIDSFEIYKKQEIEVGDRNDVKIISSYNQESTKRTVQDFVAYFTNRYKALEKILRNRKGLDGLTSISRLKGKKDRETVSIIGMVVDISITKNENIILTVEDLTGDISVLINKNKKELFEKGKEIVEDEVIGINGVSGNNIVFVNEVIFPDVPRKELKKSPEETYAAFIGDTHVGSKYFLEKGFMKFIKWIKGEIGDERQKEIVSKIRYLFILGDIIDGVGIYPTQEDDLNIPDIYKQYEKFVYFIEMIPKDITIIICAGNHDAMRISEPQPAIYEEFSEKLYKMRNVVLVSNPSVVNIASSQSFPGFDVLIYHGYSFPYFADNVESIRLSGGLKRADLLMKFLLQKRHLAPTHTSTLYIPDKNKDNLVIEKTPDFFVTGHIHRVSASTYNNITLLNCSSWLSQTDYQEKVGLEPQPGRVILSNLQTRDIKVLKFIQDEIK